MRMLAYLRLLTKQPALVCGTVMMQLCYGKVLAQKLLRLLTPSGNCSAIHEKMESAKE
jgi:hypothetical protein